MTGHTPGRWYFGNDGRDGPPIVMVTGAVAVGCDTAANRICNVLSQANKDGLLTFAKNDPERDANARLIAAAPETAAERDGLREINAELLEALELATHELNAIRARDGHPVSYQFGPNGPIRIDLCTDEWWDELTEKCFAVIAKATAS